MRQSGEKNVYNTVYLIYLFLFDGALCNSWAIRERGGVPNLLLLGSQHA